MGLLSADLAVVPHPSLSLSVSQWRQHADQYHAQPFHIDRPGEKEDWGEVKEAVETELHDVQL